MASEFDPLTVPHCTPSEPPPADPRAFWHVGGLHKWQCGSFLPAGRTPARTRTRYNPLGKSSHTERPLLLISLARNSWKCPAPVSPQPRCLFTCRPSDASGKPKLYDL